jgi:hypothetical protein
VLTVALARVLALAMAEGHMAGADVDRLLGTMRRAAVGTNYAKDSGHRR